MLKRNLISSVYVCAFFILSAPILGCNSGSSPSSSGSPASSVAATAVNPATQACTATAKISRQDFGTFMSSSTDPSTSKTAESLTPLHGHVLKAITGSADQGKFASTQDIPITVAMNLNHQDELVQALSGMYHPGSPTYHQFLTPQQFRTQFGPTPAQVAQVQAFLTSKGFHSVSLDGNGLSLHAQGSSDVINSSFNTEIHQYATPTGQSYRAPAFELQIPTGLSVQAVHGLQTLTHFHTHSRQAPTSLHTPKSGTGSGGGYAPSDIKTAYNVPTNVNGSGQVLALFELDGYTASDITAYEQAFNIPNVPLQNVLVDSASGAAGSGAAEVTLDIELMTALAPMAQQILVYEGPNSDQGILDIYQKIASDNLAKVVSSSWGTSEDGNTTAFMQSENTIFMQMAAQGQTFYVAAGDSGANDNGSTLSVDDPSSQPYAVAVGGTTLATSSTQAYVSETTWNDSSGAGGGGISGMWTIPSWQQGLATSANKGSTTMRNTPDVSLHADINTGYAIYYQGGWSTWGGTSCAAPLWAAYTALVNQQRTGNGLQSIGFISPLLYTLGTSSRFSSDFNDIKDGSTNLYYPAVAGYDNATGWGSFNGTPLFQDLIQDSVTVTTSSPTGTTSPAAPTFPGGSTNTPSSCTTGT